MRSQRLVPRVARIGLVAALAAASLGAVGATTASAYGRSASTNGCYAQWWNTAWNTTCDYAARSGYYRVNINLADQTDYRRTHYLPVGTRGVFDRGQAWRGVQTGWVSYWG